ncbi:hypothetical protein GMMP15_900003 [Candidatus Magnetomoraceae bacterium gMMP-15]
MEIEKLKLLDLMFRKGAILHRGHYILKKLGISTDTSQSKLSPYSDPKLLIAEVIAKRYIRDYDSVLLDAGSTAERIAQKMFEHRKYLSIMTNNMGAWANYSGLTAKTLDDCLKEVSSDQTSSVNESGGQYWKDHSRTNKANHRLELAGGIYHRHYDSLLGEKTIQAFETFYPNVVIIGVSGLTADEGLFCQSDKELELKKYLWKKRTTTRIIAATSDKIGRRDSYTFGDLETAKAYIDSDGKTILITDTNKKTYDHYNKLKKYLCIIEVEYFENGFKLTEKSLDKLIKDESTDEKHIPKLKNLKNKVYADRSTFNNYMNEKELDDYGSEIWRNAKGNIKIAKLTSSEDEYLDPVELGD